MSHCIEISYVVEKTDSDPHEIDGSTSMAPHNAMGTPIVAPLLFTIKAILEYSFGLYVGAATGWAFGWYAGNVYVQEVKPVYFSVHSELTEIVEWPQIMPKQSAGASKLIGAFLGATSIAAVNHRGRAAGALSVWGYGHMPLTSASCKTT